MLHPKHLASEACPRSCGWSARRRSACSSGACLDKRAYQITSRRDFPEPVAVLQMGNVWLAEDVEKWIAAKRPEID